MLSTIFGLSLSNLVPINKLMHFMSAHSNLIAQSFVTLGANITGAGNITSHGLREIE